MPKPTLIIINGLPGTGKTTLATRLAEELHLPVFSRDGLYETLFDSLDCATNGLPPLIGSASYTLLYYVAGSILAAGQSLIIEGFFGRPDLRTAEFRELQTRHPFEPFQILCKADGAVLIERFLKRIASGNRHTAHADLDWLEQNRDRLQNGILEPLALGGQLLEIDTTSLDTIDEQALFTQLHPALSSS